jgi:hypothetical protein
LTAKEIDMGTKHKRLLLLFGTAGLMLAFAQEVLAVVGRPATPVSVAGTARRTVRRNVRY